MHPENVTGKLVLDCAFRVHAALGPGLLESAYESCLAYELEKNGARIQRQIDMPLIYDGVNMDTGYRLDLLVNDSVIVELKTVEKILPVHKAQLISYLKLGNCWLGYLLNFNVLRLKDGISRVVYG